MCRIENCDEMSTVVQDEFLTARKPHRCGECRRIIEHGEGYRRERLKFDGSMYTHKTCAHCLVVRDWLSSECDGWVYTEVAADIREHFFEGYYPMITGRLAAGMHRYWRTIKGNLMPIPRLPEQQGGEI